MLREFVRLNSRVCSVIERYLPQAKQNMSSLYEEVVAKHMLELERNSVIVDVGGGEKCAFAEFKPARSRIIAVDSSEQELCQNQDVDETRVADATKGLPFRDNEVDMVVSKHVLEHLHDIKGFVLEANRILKINGYFIHFFPARYALFAIVNRLIPGRLAQRLVHSFLPETKGTRRFRAYYDRCFYSGFRSLLSEAGFQVDKVYVSYYQSHYFSFFVPLFLLSSFYELLLYCISPKDLAACLLVVARKS